MAEPINMAVLAMQVDGIADRIARVPVQGDDAATLRLAAQVIRGAGAISETWSTPATASTREQP